MQIKVKKLTPTAKTPTRAYNTDSGLDLYLDEEVVLQPLQRHLASTGIAVQLPKPNFWEQSETSLHRYVYECTIRPKSGLSAKGLYVALGTIDNSYTGELKVILINLSNEVMEFKSGQKIAQLVVQKVYLPDIVEVEELEERVRSSNGFGSTGLN
jgi:dUTP pyrophosphatase